MSSHLDEQSSRRHTMELQLWVRAVNHPTDTNHNFVRMSQALAQQLHDLALDLIDDVEPLVFAQLHSHLAWIPNRTTCGKTIDFLPLQLCIHNTCIAYASFNGGYMDTGTLHIIRYMVGCGISRKLSWSQ